MGHTGSAACCDAILVPGTAPVGRGQTVLWSLLSAEAAPRRQGAAFP